MKQFLPIHDYLEEHGFELEFANDRLIARGEQKTLEEISQQLMKKGFLTMQIEWTAYHGIGQKTMQNIYRITADEETLFLDLRNKENYEIFDQDQFEYL